MAPTIRTRINLLESYIQLGMRSKSYVSVTRSLCPICVLRFHLTAFEKHPPKPPFSLSLSLSLSLPFPLPGHVCVVSPSVANDDGFEFCQTDKNYSRKLHKAINKYQSGVF